MPLSDAGFIRDNGLPDPDKLVIYGPTTQVIVKHYQIIGVDTPVLQETVFGLIDTGASESCIDLDLAEKLKLPVVDVQTMAGVGGADEYPVYMAQIDIPNLGTHQYGRFACVKLASGGQEHKVLLGRTMLQQFIMIYDGVSGLVTLAI
jgi:predicted aspartyl protease